MNDPPLERRRRVGDDSSATFSTADLPQADRIGLWEEYQDEHLIGLRCRTLDSGPFLATEVQAERGRVRLARVTGTPHLVERSGADIRRTPTESVVLYLGRGGESFFHHEHGTVVLAPGQLVVCDADRPFFRGFNSGLDELVVQVPRDALAELAGGHLPDLRRPLVIGGGPREARVRALAAIIESTTLERSTDDPTTRESAEATVVGLVATLMGGVGAPSAHLAAARAYVETHLADPGMSAATIASGIALSERQLSRVFAAAGTSVPEYVLDRRLEHAARLLGSPAGATMTVSQAARHAGIASPSHFSRSFTRRFGMGPAEFRRSAQTSR